MVDRALESFVVFRWTVKLPVLFAMTFVPSCGGAGIYTPNEPLDLSCGGESSCLRECQRGVPRVCYELGVGLEEAERFDEAADVHQRACNFGDIRGCAGAIRALRIANREGEADSVLREQCQRSSEICRELLTELDEPMGSVALGYLRDDCRRGAALSCRSLGMALLNLGDPRNAVEPLDQSCDAGDLESCAILGDVYESLGEQLPARAARRRAAELGGREGPSGE